MRPLQKTCLILAALLVLPTDQAGLLADTVYTVDGGSFKGKARKEGDRVIVEIPGGSITLDSNRVLRIEPGDDLSAKLEESRQKLGPRDADGYYRLGLWAVQNDLLLQARDLLAQAIKIQPDHELAHRALGHVFLDGAWADGETLKETLSQWLGSGLNEAVFQTGRQALAGLLSPTERRTVLEATAVAARRLGYFAQAQADCRELAALTPRNDPQYERLTTIAELLKDHPAGLYLVQVEELAQPAGGADQDEPTRSGFYSLADDPVLDHALRDRAKALIGQGQTAMTAAKAAEVTDPTKSIGQYNQAEDSFIRAEALVSDIARSYRVEVRRRQIQIHQSAAEALALRFDALMRQLPPLVKNKAGYVNQLKLMLGLLDDIQKGLDQILALAAPYQQEFSFIITWTQEDLATVKAMRKTLRGELDQAGSVRPPG